MGSPIRAVAAAPARATRREAVSRLQGLEKNDPRPCFCSDALIAAGVRSLSSPRRRLPRTAAVGACRCCGLGRGVGHLDVRPPRTGLLRQSRRALGMGVAFDPTSSRMRRLCRRARLPSPRALPRCSGAVRVPACRSCSVPFRGRQPDRRRDALGVWRRWSRRHRRSCQRRATVVAIQNRRCDVAIIDIFLQSGAGLDVLASREGQRGL